MNQRRRYDMTGRAAAAAETRSRIIAAAVKVYAREGFKNATMHAIALQAEVSPSTILNHFATPEELLAAALEVLRQELQVPRLAEIKAARGARQRVTMLARGLSSCFQRSDHWYAIYARERYELPALREASDAFFRDFDALIRAALGPSARDKRTHLIASVLLGPATLSALRAGGMSADAAALAAAELLLGWLRSNQREEKP